MAEKSSFFNSVSGDRKYKAEDWAAYFATFVSSGVVLKSNATLAVSADGGSMSVTLAAGSAFYNGWRYENTEPLSLAIPTANASLNRIDAIMIRWNRNLRAMNAYVVQGTAAAAPVAPAPGRTADIGELCVATVYVAAGATSISQSVLTDKRLDTAVCGIATMIGELDTSTLYAQVQAAISDFESGSFAQFTSWFAGIRDMLGADAAGNLLNMIMKYKAKNTTVVLAVADWALSGGVYTCEKSVAMVPANCALHVSPVWASRTAYGDAECGVSDASAGSVTFTATSLPAEALTVNLSISEVDA